MYFVFALCERKNEIQKEEKVQLLGTHDCAQRLRVADGVSISIVIEVHEDLVIACLPFVQARRPPL